MHLYSFYADPFCLLELHVTVGTTIYHSMYYGNGEMLQRSNFKKVKTNYLNAHFSVIRGILSWDWQDMTSQYRMLFFLPYNWLESNNSFLMSWRKEEINCHFPKRVLSFNWACWSNRTNLSSSCEDVWVEVCFTGHQYTALEWQQCTAGFICVNLHLSNWTLLHKLKPKLKHPQPTTMAKTDSLL